MRNLLQLVSHLTFNFSPYIDPAMIRDDCKKRVVGHANQSYKKFDTWQTAIAAYTASYNIGGVIATPDPGSVYWTEPIPRISEPGHSSLDSEDALWASFGEEDCKARDDLERMMRGLNVANK